jgi:hypothetical protein
MNDCAWFFFTLEEVNDGFMFTQFYPENIVYTEKLTFIGAAEKDEVVWKGNDVIISADKPEEYTLEDVELFINFLLGNDSDLGNKDFDLNKDGILNIFDLIELKKVS